DLDLLLALSEHISVAIHRAQLYDTVRNSEERLRAALSAAQMATWDWDVPAGRIVRSREMPSLYGGDASAPSDDFDAFRSIIHPEDLAAMDETDRRLREGGAAAYEVEYRVRLPDGETRWLRDQGDAVRFAGGKPVRVLGVTMDVTERKRAELALAAERDLLTTLMDHLPHAVYIKDTASRFLRLNPVAARHLGLRDANEAIGKTDFDFLPFNLARQYFADEQRVMRSGQPVLNRLEPQDEGDPPRIWWLTSTVPLHNTEGDLIGLIGSGHDVSDRIRLEGALRDARDAAEAASRAKSDFLSTMSHEFRTPMNAIVGYAHLLRDALDGPLTPAQQADVDRIIEAADRLLGLIDNVLELAQLESGRIHLSPQQLDLIGVLRDVCADAGPEARRKGVDLALDLPTDLPPTPADPERLRQIFHGLIDNAVKFTDAGRITVRGHTDGDMVEVSIADTGIGISPEFVPVMFDPFLQAESGGSRRFGGSGLGLAIAHRLIELHGGAIAVQSAPGEGTVMTVRLPALICRGAPK
ncbi:MAG: PAS domain-containing protein, partial [Thermomicrobiales bacterium]|nr:PAS domain-containing protein [Thermomicrobiales bacterium]